LVSRLKEKNEKQRETRRHGYELGLAIMKSLARRYSTSD